MRWRRLSVCPISARLMGARLPMCLGGQNRTDATSHLRPTARVQSSLTSVHFAAVAVGRRDLIALKHGLVTEGAASTALACQAVANGGAYRLTRDLSSQLSTTARGKTFRHGALSRVLNASMSLCRYGGSQRNAQASAALRTADRTESHAAPGRSGRPSRFARPTRPPRHARAVRAR